MTGGAGAPRSFLAERTVVIASSRLPSASRRSASLEVAEPRELASSVCLSPQYALVRDTDARPGSPRSRATKVEVR
jgi:hypothetical protein